MRRFLSLNITLRRSLSAAVLLALLLSACITPPGAITSGRPPVINPDEVAPPAAATPPQPAPAPVSMWDRLLQMFRKQEKAASEPPAPAKPAVAPTPAAPVTPAPTAPAPETVTAPKSAAAENQTAATPRATPALTPARDLNGVWKGTGTYYQLDMVSGERVRKITVEVTAQIKQNGQAVEIEMDYRAIKREPEGDIKEAGWWERELKAIGSTYTIRRMLDDEIPAGYEEARRYRRDLIAAWGASNDGGDTWTRWLKGTVGGTTVALELFPGNNPALERPEKWEFTFTTDLMSGGVKSVPGKISGGTYYYGRGSDPKDFALTRQK